MTRLPLDTAPGAGARGRAPRGGTGARVDAPAQAFIAAFDPDSATGPVSAATILLMLSGMV